MKLAKTRGELGMLVGGILIGVPAVMFVVASRLQDDGGGADGLGVIASYLFAAGSLLGGAIVGRVASCARNWKEAAVLGGAFGMLIASLWLCGGGLDWGVRVLFAALSLLLVLVLFVVVAEVCAYVARRGGV